ncbi:hypothetical protein CEXT_521821 [Caerostris extrusa]|uniref:Uncharacterized protein n=1 Tax=Caerostris extrusa TaxID=172846 RepID=A0AAV4Y0H0_CAEEX|nr:hypothetical protein CEXT_521821 [Caerostris extrusa]
MHGQNPTTGLKHTLEQVSDTTSDYSNDGSDTPPSVLNQRCSHIPSSFYMNHQLHAVNHAYRYCQLSRLSLCQNAIISRHKAIFSIFARFLFEFRAEIVYACLIFGEATAEILERRRSLREVDEVRSLRPTVILDHTCRYYNDGYAAGSRTGPVASSDHRV